MSLLAFVPRYFNVNGEDVICRPVFLGTNKIGEAEWTGMWATDTSPPKFFNPEPSKMVYVALVYGDTCPTCGGDGRVVKP